MHNSTFFDKMSLCRCNQNNVNFLSNTTKSKNNSIGIFLVCDRTIVIGFDTCSFLVIEQKK